MATFAIPVAAQIAPDLGTAAPYTLLGTNSVPTSGTVTCTTSTVDGDVGTTGNSITNTGCAITGTIAAPVAASVVTDFGAAFNAVDAANLSCDDVIPIVSTTLPPAFTVQPLRPRSAPASRLPLMGTPATPGFSGLAPVASAPLP